MSSGTANIFATFQNLPLTNKNDIPRVILPSKSVQLDNLLILLDPLAEQKIIAFHLEEKRFLPVKLQGKDLQFSKGWNACAYGLNKIIVLEANERDDELKIGFLFLHREPNEIQMKYESFVLQDGPAFPFHSANVVDKNLILYGGSKNGLAVETLTLINLETFSCTNKATIGKAKPGPLFNHTSLLHNGKLYVLGGQGLFSKPNLGVYVLDLVKYEWTKLTECPKTHATAQIDNYCLYLFGDNNKTHNHLSVFNLKNKFWYQVIRKGGGPIAKSSYVSAQYKGQMIIFGEKSLHGTENIYSLILEDKSLSNYIRQMSLQMELSKEENQKDAETLQKVKELLRDEKHASDVVFKVQNEEFPAHKDVLSLRSTFFSNMFSSGMKESYAKEIVLDDISKEALQALLAYFYEGTLPSAKEIVGELSKYSEKILLKRLEVYCEKTLLEFPSP